MLKYRLFEIDVVINKTVVFASLAVFITAVYVASWWAWGRSSGPASNPFLSAVAAAVVAIAFQPVRGAGATSRRPPRVRQASHARTRSVRVLRTDRRHLCHRRHAPAHGAGHRRGHGRRAGRRLARVGGELRSGRRRPSADGAPSLERGPTAESCPAVARFPVRHQGELLGALSVVKPPGELDARRRSKLVADLAAQAGLVLRNAGSPRSSRAARGAPGVRQRLVSAQDEERRKIERNLHDGAQQQLVALAVKLRLAEQIADRDAAKTKAMLAQLQAETGDALETLRDLARGIYPPLLADQGLARRARGAGAQGAGPGDVEADGIGRYPQDVEAAVYFCCLEALQNVAKYADASRRRCGCATATARSGSRSPTTERGSTRRHRYGTGLQGMADRLACAGRRHQDLLRSPGAGTTVLGSVPVPT